MKNLTQQASWVSEVYEQGASENDWHSLQIETVIPKEEIYESLMVGNVLYSFRSDVTSVLAENQNGVIREELTSPLVDASGSIDQFTYSGRSFSVASQDGIPSGIAFSPDGTTMFIVGYGTDSVYQYTLPTPWDLTGASYASKSLDVSSQDTSPTGIAFSSDGTTMFMVGWGSDSVYQYTLPTPWDLTGASYASKSLIVNVQDTNPTGIAFSSDGTTMFMVGSTSTTVYQYTLPTPWDLTGASYASKSLNVDSQESTPQGIAFSPDGTRMFMVGWSSDTLYQYTLPTPWDLTGASYASKSLDVSSQETNPQGIAFSSDGTRMFMVGNASDNVYQYDFTDPDISLAQYMDIVLDTSSQETAPAGIAFSPDGTTMFMVGWNSDNVYQYTLPTPWDLSGASYTGKSFSVAGQDTAPTGIAFSSDGTRMFIVDNSIDDVYQYTLSTPWDLTGASYASKSLSVVSQDTDPQGIAFSSDGTTMFMVGLNSDTVYQYTLPTPWDLTGASYAAKSLNVSSQDTSPTGIAFSSDGTRMFILGNGTDSVYQYTLSTPWDLSGASYASKSFSVTSQEPSPQGIAFSPDGTRMFISGSSSDSVYQYYLPGVYSLFSIKAEKDLGTLYSAIYKDILGGIDLTVSAAKTETALVFENSTSILDKCLPVNKNLSNTSAIVIDDFDNDSDAFFTAGTQMTTFSLDEIDGYVYDTKSLSVTAQDTYPMGIAFSPDGTTMFMVGFDSDSVYQYTLPTPWDLTGASYASKSFSVASQDDTSHDIAFSSDGTRMFILGNGTDSVYQYTLPTPWDLTGASYASKSFSVSSQDGSPAGIAFSSDGTTMFMVGWVSDNVYQYTLPTPWDLTGASYASKSLDVSSQDATPASIAFSSDGTRMFILGGDTDSVYQYTLPTPWDLTGASYASKSLSVVSQDTGPGSIFFSSDGTTMFILGLMSDTVYQYQYTPQPYVETPNDITVTNNATILSGTFSAVRDFVQVEDFTNSYSGNANVFQSNSSEIIGISEKYSLNTNDKRFVQFRIDTTDFVNISSVRINLWKRPQ